ncbi:MAG: glycerate kinase [Ignavibacterium sp.]|jgi:glycerate kinase|nr:glycerate kinase [Ignavibacterium sp.]
MNVLICPNSYKECADSTRIAEILKQEFSVKSELNLICRPLTDGGDGFIKVCENIYNLKNISAIDIITYGDNLNECQVLYSEKDKRVFIETAQIFGLKRFSEHNRSPLAINSSALGVVLQNLVSLVDNHELEINSIWIGVGGTATIDFGVGACSEFGLKLFDENSVFIEPLPISFNRAVKLKFDFQKLPFRVYCIVDVETELLGNPGAVEIYGPQKGASSEDIEKIKSGISNILSLIKSDFRLPVPDKLNGAGGGLAAGLNIFLGAEIISAEKFISNEILKDIDFSKIDLVVSGEGKFDLQSLEGKATGVLVKICQENSIPLYFINGSTELTEKIKLPAYIHFINLSDFYGTKLEAIQNYEEGIQRAAEIVIKQIIK